MTPLCKDARIHGLRTEDWEWGLRKHRRAMNVPAAVDDASKCMERSWGVPSDLAPLWVEGEAFHSVALGLELRERIQSVSVAPAMSMLPSTEG